MERLKIPDTATETYLEKLESRIRERLTHPRNESDRMYLESILQDVHKRQQAFVHKATSESETEPTIADDGELLLTETLDETSETGPEQSFDTGEETGEELLLTEMLDEEPPPEALIDHDDKDLSEKERQVVKDRLKGVLKKFQEQQHPLPQRPQDFAVTEIIREVSTEAPIDKIELSEHEEGRIKNRLHIILEALKQTEKYSDEAVVKHLSKEIGEEPDPSETATLHPQSAAGPPSATKATPEEATETQTLHFDDKKARILDEVCKKVANGDPLSLFDSVQLSDREQQLVDAFIKHLSAYKGMKKQQAFEMQHLTARSIKELDQIFKTYHIQGYLKAELTNIYNRLLNLRSRFSVMLY